MSNPPETQELVLRLCREKMNQDLIWSNDQKIEILERSIRLLEKQSRWLSRELKKYEKKSKKKCHVLRLQGTVKNVSYSLMRMATLLLMVLQSEEFLNFC